MSGYIKRIIILRGLGDPVVLKCESGASVSVSASAELSGRTLALYDGKLMELFDSLPVVGSRADLSKGLAAGLISDGRIVAFGGAGECVSRSEFTKIYESVAISSAEAIKTLNGSLYDDDKIADENYYDNRAIEDFNYEEQSNKHDETKTRNAAERRAGACENQAADYAAAADACASEERAEACHDGGDFYSTVRVETQKLFSRGTKEHGLGEVVPSSKWVRINYTADRYYVVGIIEKQNRPEFLCYGVPGRYGNPPEKLKGLASFIPASLYDLHGDGFYVMFQSARSGEHVVPKIDVFGL